MRLNHHRGGAGEPLVLIHGIGSRWQMWEPVLGRLEAERDVVALDLPGFAASPAPPAGTPAGIAPLTDLVCAFLDELGLERPHVGGNSLGGWVALELAKRERAASATALSPAGFMNRLEAGFQVASLWLAVRGARLLARQPALASRLLDSPAGRRAALAQYFADPARLSPREAIESIHALAAAPWFDATLPAINADRFAGGERATVPVTIGWGEHDRLLVRRQALRAGRAIPGARVVILRGCGHIPTYDDPEQVAQVLLAGSRSTY